MGDEPKTHDDDDEMILVSGPDKLEATGSSPDTCKECGATVWRSDASRLPPTDKATVLCLECGLKRLKRDPLPQIMVTRAIAEDVEANLKALRDRKAKYRNN